LQKTTNRAFLYDLGGYLAAGFILICVAISVLAYVIAPDNSVNANQMHLSIHSQAPGFKVKMLHVPTAADKDHSRLSMLLFGNPNAGNQYPISSYQVDEDGIWIEHFNFDSSGQQEWFPINAFNGLASPSEIADQHIADHRFVLGTDLFGRDVLSRLLVGTRISLSIGLISVFISLIVGIFLGSLGGFYGGVVDKIVMWIINVTWSIPTLLLVIAISVALGKGFWQVFIAVGLTMWVEVARIVRGQVMSIKNRQYVIATQVLGFSTFRTLFGHILPNAFGPLVVITASNFAAAILIESGLSFLGIGVQPPIPSWGTMIKDHYQFLVMGKPYLALIPGLAIMLLVSSFMWIGNSLRDRFDPVKR
jgi:peptide/nickel transport system permease protein